MSQAAAEVPHRSQPLPLPPQDLDLSRFPSRTIAAGQRLYRAHAQVFGNNCWYFANLQNGLEPGRFDGPGPAHGTCYTATDPLTALAERAGFKVLVGPDLPYTALDEALLSEITTTRPYHVANLTRRDSLKFWACGRELSALTPYDLPHAWAQRWQDAGFEGILYHPRHDSRDRVRSLALFEPDDPGQRPDHHPGPADVYLKRLAHAYHLPIGGHLTDCEVLPDPDPTTT
ncbi:RES family NAD+ phosphorylase [Streptacidiphilus sp. EB103A]|uniref:RES family NAD+ phosphorylase n=1 Tax=Streptacidiphilus sp. EB103A TaxID=3156275 RepID=UPI0035158A8F